MFHYFYWFSVLCNYKWCVTSYINLVAKFFERFYPNCINFFFLLTSAICPYAIACKKTEKILDKIKGTYRRRSIQGTRVETSQIEKARKSWFDARERQGTTKRYRERKKAGKTTITSPAHKTTSTLTRAIRKAESSLPNSPWKRSQVFQELFEETCCSISRSPAKTLGRSSVSQVIVTMVEYFYEQDDIPRQAPANVIQ